MSRLVMFVPLHVESLARRVPIATLCWPGGDCFRRAKLSLVTNDQRRLPYCAIDWSQSCPLLWTGERLDRFFGMSRTRILYFRGGILETTDEVPFDDLVEAARAASSKHPHLTAEIWRDGRKVAVVRPCWNSATEHG